MWMITSVLLILGATSSADKIQPAGVENEKAMVVEVGKRFISTGSQESGNVDRRTGDYSGSSAETGYSVWLYTLRLAKSTVVVQYDSRTPAETIIAAARWFRKAPILSAKAGDTVSFARGPHGAQVIADGKSYNVSVVKETLGPVASVASVVPSQAPGDVRSELARDLRAQFAENPVVFLQKRLRTWTPLEVDAIAGAPMGHRYAYDQAKNIVGDIFAYPDPSNDNDKIECRFDRVTRKLQNLIVFPRNLTWEECRKNWGDKATVTEGSEGRQFYEYQDRHLFVLVDKSGRVLNLTIY